MLLPPVQYEDPDLARQIAESFAWAFFSKHMIYTNKLVYDDPEVPESMNFP